MSIDPFQDDLKAYLDGELSWLRRLAVRRHLTQCASCRKEISQMTQIAEDLRESETDAALPAELRAKILAVTGEEAPPPQVWGAGKKGHSSPVPPLLGARGRTRPALGWAIAGVALIAWFICYPMLHTLNYTRGAQALYSPMDAKRIQMEHGLSPRLKPSPQKPVQLQVRLSDREAGVDDNGASAANPKVYVQIKNPDSVYQTFGGNGIVPAPPAAKPQIQTADVVGDSLRQVHKEASIGVQVPNPETTSDTVETMVTATGGYVAANNLSTGDDGMKTAELIVKVPVAQFETFLSQISKLGNVQSKNITGEDITEKTSDADQTEAVLEDDVQQSEARLKALGGKAKWHDQEATRELRIQLAQARARLVLLKRMAALGTLTIDLSQTPKAVPPPPPVTGGFLSGLKGTTHDALLSLLNSAGALLALVIWLLAYAPLWIPLLLVGRYALKEYRKRAVV